MRVLVVDDEPVARRVLLRFLADEPEVTSVDECSNGREARDRLGRGDVDVVFLDIHMPEIDGFGALDGRDSETPLAIVFVTASEEHALRAIDVGAAAYLLKPFDQAGFARAFDKARTRLHQEQLLEKSVALSRLLGGEAVPSVATPTPSERLSLPDGNGVRRLRMDEIRWVEAADKHVVIHTPDGELRIRMTLSDLEKQLDPRAFLRVHRCNIVALEQVEALGSTSGGAPYLELSGGDRVVVSRARVRAVRAALTH